MEEVKKVPKKKRLHQSDTKAEVSHGDEKIKKNPLDKKKFARQQKKRKFLLPKKISKKISRVLKNNREEESTKEEIRN